MEEPASVSEASLIKCSLSVDLAEIITCLVKPEAPPIREGSGPDVTSPALYPPTAFKEEKNKTTVTIKTLVRNAFFF